MDEQTTKVLVDTLFPEHPHQQHPVREVPKDEIPLFTEAEMAEAIGGMKNGRPQDQTEYQQRPLRKLLR